MRAWILAALLTVWLAWPALAAPPERPTLAVVPNEAPYPIGDRRLAEAVHAELARVARFTLVMPAGAEAGSGSSEERAIARAEASGAAFAVLVGFGQDPDARFVRFTDLSGQYVARSEVGLVVLEVATRKERLRQSLIFYGESPSSKEAAESYAYEHAARETARLLRKTFRLTTRLTARDGRHVTVANGEDLGLQEGMLFSGTSPDGEPVGRIRVTRVASQSAEGELLSGYYDLQAGAELREQPYGSPPAGAGILYAGLVSPTAGSFTGVSLDYNRTGYGWGASLAFGELRQEAVTGFALWPHVVYQHEVWPERLWVQSELGAAVGLLSQGIPGSGDRASSYSLHGALSLGLAGHLFGGLGASLGLAYLTPWQADRWNQTTGVSEPVAASGRVPHPVLGGLGWTAGLTWAF